MKVLFDACVPRPLKRHLTKHEVRTAQEEGWDRLTNGDLIAAAEPLFDVLVTSDQNIKYQQHLSGRRIAIVVLPTNFLPAVMGLSPKVVEVLETITAGDFVEIVGGASTASSIEQ